MPEGGAPSCPCPLRMASLAPLCPLFFEEWTPFMCVPFLSLTCPAPPPPYSPQLERQLARTQERSEAEDKAKVSLHPPPRPSPS